MSTSRRDDVPKLKPSQSRYRPSRTTYTDEKYVDDHGNRWIIRISGEAKVVRTMVEKGHIALDAEPIDEAAWKQAIEVWQTEKHDGQSDYPRMSELPSLETNALLIKAKDYRYWRIHYEFIVPYAGNSWHLHSVDVGSDCLAKVGFSADLSPIKVYLGGDYKQGLSGEVSWKTTNASIALWVYEKGTGYRFTSGDTVTPPVG